MFFIWFNLEIDYRDKIDSDLKQFYII